MSGRRRIDIGIGLALLAAAVAVRASELGPSSLWLDDAWVGFVHRADWGDLPDMGLTSPGFLFVMKAWFSVVGFSELKAQVPAFVAGVIGPVVLYGLLRLHVRRSVALVLAAVFVLSPVHARYSTHVKQYSIEVVVGLAILGAALWVREKPQERTRWWLLAALAVIGPIFSFVLVSVSAFAVLGALPAVRRDAGPAVRTAFATAAVAAAIPGLWYLAVVRDNASPSLRRFWSAHYVDGSSPRALLRTSAERIHDLAEVLTPFPAEVVLPVAAAVLVGLLWRRPVVFVMTAGPLALAYGMAVFDYAPLGGGRTDIYLIAPVFVGVALGAESLLERVDASDRLAPARSVAGAVLVVAVVIGVAGAGFERRGYPAEDARPLIAVLEEERRSGDVVFLYAQAGRAYGLYADVAFEVIDGTPYRLAFDDDLLVLQESRGADPAAALARELDPEVLAGRIWILGTHFGSDWERLVAQVTIPLQRDVVQRWNRDGAELILVSAA